MKDKKLNIAIFMDNFYPQVNGVVTSSINTAVELSKRGHNIYGFVSYAGKLPVLPKDYFPFKIQFHKGFPAFIYPDFNFTFPFAFKALRELKKFKPDIIHFHAPITLGYLAIRIARQLKIPVVGTFHTFFAEPEYLSVVNMDKFKFLINFGWWYSNQFFNRCDAVVSPGKATAKILLDKKLDNKLHVVSNGVDAHKYKNFKFNSKQFPIDTKEDEEWILFIGRISKEKCLDDLINACEIVIQKRKQARLLIVGDGPYKNELQKITIKKGIAKKVFFSGMIPNKDLLESGILKKMKLFATASTSENQPMTILESIMFGLPIVGVDAKGVPELIEGNGYIVPPNNPVIMAEKILHILENKAVHEKFNKMSIRLAAKYDIKNTTNKMEELYYDLINN